MPQTFSDEYGRLFPTVLAARESAGDAYETQSRLTEDLVKCLWAGGHLDQGTLTTADGQALRVFSPGQWNLESGPDFKGAELQFDSGNRIMGDVEVHLHPSGWRQHSHFRDPAYNNVVLIVELEGYPRRAFEETAAGRRVPRLILEQCSPGVARSLRDVPGQFSPAQLRLDLAGACGRKLATDDHSRLERLLDLAGEWRLLTKASLISTRIAEAGIDQAFYEALMEVLGYKAHKIEFARIAKAWPLAEMQRVTEKLPAQKRPLVFQAVLFTRTGMLPTDFSDFDAETQRYLTSLAEIRADLKLTFSPIAWFAWRRAPSRPANTPLRRVVAASYLLSWLSGSSAEEIIRGMFSLERSKAVNLILKLAAGLSPRFNEYWLWRFTWGGQKTQKPCSIIGGETVKLMLVNALIPFAIAVARRVYDLETERNALSFFRSFPSLSTNSITRYMQRRLASATPTARSTFRGACRQMGLIQLHHDWCSHNPSCHQCAVPPLL